MSGITYSAGAILTFLETTTNWIVLGKRQKDPV